MGCLFFLGKGDKMILNVQGVVYEVMDYVAYETAYNLIVKKSHHEEAGEQLIATLESYDGGDMIVVEVDGVKTNWGLPISFYFEFCDDENRNLIKYVDNHIN